MENFRPESSSPEKKREKFNHIKVFRVRHGDTDYYEHTKERALGPDDSDITKKGENQMNAAARIIGRKLDKIWILSASLQVRVSGPRTAKK